MRKCKRNKKKRIPFRGKNIEQTHKQQAQRRKKEKEANERAILTCWRVRRKRKQST
jgi:hypothetical protein